MVNIAQIGVGYWGPNLLRNFMLHKDFSVIMAVDISPERRTFVNELYPNVEVSNDYMDAIDDPNIQAIIIATPVNSHYGIAMRALESGKHVLVEKPMSTKLEEIEQIGQLANEKNLVAMVGHTFIYNAAVRLVKRLIDSGELGSIRYINSQRLNLGRIRTDVDALWNFAPHDISIIQYWLGDTAPISITKNGMAYVQNKIHDVGFMNIIYPDDIMVNIHVSWLDPQRVRRMTVVGSKKMVVYDDLAENKIAIYDKGIDRMAVLGEHMDFDDHQGPNFNLRSGDVLLPKIHWEEPLKVEIEHFNDCIMNDIPCLTDAEHAKQVVKILSSE